MKALDLSIIIVSYNTRKLTVECVESILKTAKKISYEITVVDNASSDDSVDEIQKLKGENQNLNSKIKIIKNDQNFGFSKANNIGIKQSSGRYVLFLNSDTVVREKTLDGMVEFMDSHKDAGAATCQLDLPNGEIDDASHRGFPTPVRSLFQFSGLAKIFSHSQFWNGYHLGWHDLDKTHEIEALAGAFMIVRREAGEALKWWDEDYFWYGEDLDFCYRLSKNGWKIYYVPEFTTLHYKGASGGLKKTTQNITTASKETKMKATKARFDAMRIFYGKHYKDKYPVLLNMLVLNGINLRGKFAEWKIK